MVKKLRAFLNAFLVDRVIVCAGSAIIGLIACLGLLNSCTSRNPEGPIQVLLVPSQENKILVDNGNILKAWLETDLQRAVEVKVPVNYIAVIEAFGSKRADVAFMNSFGYLLARKKYGAQARLIAVSQGKTEYRGQIIVRKGKVQSLADLNGKTFGFVSPISGSGYVAALKYLREHKILIKDQSFLGSHDAVVTAVYQGRVDAGATFYADDEAGQPQDARRLVKTQFPDVFEKIERLALTEPLPNEPVVFRADMPENLKIKIIQSLQKFIATDLGHKTFRELYHYENLVPVTEKVFDSLEQEFARLGLEPEKTVSGK